MFHIFITDYDSFDFICKSDSSEVQKHKLSNIEQDVLIKVKSGVLAMNNISLGMRKIRASLFSL